jgi:ribonuclease HI
MAGRFRAAIDGGSKGNPGAAAWGVAILDEEGAYVEGHAGLLGTATNNVAEYHGLLEALALAKTRGADSVEIFADSELIVRQIQGRYRVRNPGLIPLHAKAKKLIEGFRVFRITHVPRKENREADRLVHVALKRAEKSAPGDQICIFERPDPTPVAD